MSNTRFCLECSKKIPFKAIKCPYYNTNQYGENNEYYPDEKSLCEAKKIFKKIAQTQNTPKNKPTKKGFSDEEILALGLYPKDEGYKMSLISRILGK